MPCGVRTPDHVIVPTLRLGRGMRAEQVLQRATAAHHQPHEEPTRYFCVARVHLQQRRQIMRQPREQGALSLREGEQASAAACNGGD